MLRAGFQCLAAVDFNAQAVETLRANLQAGAPTGLPKVGFAFEADLTLLPPERLALLINTHSVDVIVGGPPCQGFSTARQFDGSNHGTSRFREDSRRHLFRDFLRYVDYFQPKVFVIENVLGLRSAAGGRYFSAVQHEARILGMSEGRSGYRVHAQIENSSKLGVPQKRRRQLIIGVRADLPGYFPSELKLAERAPGKAMLGDAIGDLPVLGAGEGAHSVPYDLRRRTVNFLGGVRDRVRTKYLYNVLEVLHSAAVFNHVARPHSARDLRDFLRIEEGRSSAELLREGVKFEFPYAKTSFKDRYTRQHRNRPCSTIVAHLSKDGLMFIHPTQNRSLTPREAARAQSFPDWFVFPTARTHSFRIIGNAVPPLVGEAVGDAVLLFLSTIGKRPRNAAGRIGRFSSTVPRGSEEAASHLQLLMHCDRERLGSLDLKAFLKGWHALLWLFPGLHPDNALDHGTEKIDWPDASDVFPQIEPGRRQCHVRSGWPVSLVLIAEEAWRRFDSGGITDEAFYCAEAQYAGLVARGPSRSVRLV